MGNGSLAHLEEAAVSADKHYDDRDFVTCLRTLNVTPHVAQKEKITALDARTTRHSGYGISQRFRKRVEEVFGWLKTVGLCRQTLFRGRERVGWMFTFAVAAYNLVRLRNLRGGGRVTRQGELWPASAGRRRWGLRATDPA
jgi:DDE family transposase